jgi:hypothetical protein
MGVYWILSILIWGSLIGSSTLDISKKKGLNPNLGFGIGLIFHIPGLIIILLLPSKNGYIPETPLLKRLLFGLVRFGITLVLLTFLTPLVDLLYNVFSGLSSIIIVSLLKYGLIVIGLLWTFRGKYCLNLQFPEEPKDSDSK